LTAARATHNDGRGRYVMSAERQMENLSAERVAKNDATFRVANERIRDAAAENEVEEGIPFICECADPACTTILRLSVDEYETVRAEPTHFVNAHGHHVNGLPHVRVVEERATFEIVEKLGRAADVAEELDPRERASD
jgi:hypothetical protein